MPTAVTLAVMVSTIVCVCNMQRSAGMCLWNTAGLTDMAILLSSPQRLVGMPPCCIQQLTDVGFVAGTKIAVTGYLGTAAVYRGWLVSPSMPKKLTVMASGCSCTLAKPLDTH